MRMTANMHANHNELRVEIGWPKGDLAVLKFGSPLSHDVSLWYYNMWMTRDQLVQLHNACTEALGLND